MTAQTAAPDDHTTSGPAMGGDPQAAAIRAWVDAAARGEDLSGAELGRRFGRSPQWGRQMAALARAGLNGHHSAHGQPIAAMAPGAWHVAITTAAVVIVAAVAAALSYEHMRQVALVAGEGRWQAAVWPLAVDGLLVAGSMTALRRRRAAVAIGALPAAAIVLGLGVSVAANTASAEPTALGRLIAAWPPLALGLSFELLLTQLRTHRKDQP